MANKDVHNNISGKIVGYACAHVHGWARDLPSRGRDNTETLDCDILTMSDTKPSLVRLQTVSRLHGRRDRV